MEIENNTQEKGFTKIGNITADASTAVNEVKKIAREPRERRSGSRRKDGQASYSPTPDNSPIHRHRF